MFAAKPEDGAVWITGASEGIGKDVALELADEGFTVYVSARSAEKLAELAASYSGNGNIVPLPLDVTDREAMKRGVEQIEKETGRLAVCILNAGTFIPARGKALDYKTFDNTLNVNVNGVINGLVPAIEVMKASGQGQIAIVSSVAGYSGLPKNASYGLSKAGLINMAESLKFDLDRVNIKLQIVTPGFVDTPLTQKNEFPMPFMISGKEASKRIANGLKQDRFEITFPRRFTWLIKFANLLPYPIYFWLVRKITGAR